MPQPERAAFLDRDGTIIREMEFVADPHDVQLLPGAIEGLRQLRDAGFLLVVITNQSGIARGLFDEAAFRAVQRRVDELLAEHGITLDGVWFCPHHPDFTGPCDCRKPGLALFRQAAETLGIDPARSVFIGDRIRDVEPALALGGTAALVRTGYGEAECAGAPPGTVVAADLREAAERVVGQGYTVDSDRQRR